MIDFSVPIVVWVSLLRLGSLPCIWLATAIWPSTMPPGRNGGLIRLVLSNKQGDDRERQRKEKHPGACHLLREIDTDDRQRWDVRWA